MDFKKATIANWGNYPKAQAELIVPGNRDDVRLAVLSSEKIIARGNGKCYGDAALGPRVLSTLKLNHLLHFDAETGIVQCESGVLLGDLLQHIVPAGWFFQVTPGIKNVTVGGAIASDVHGKNHPAKGCFSNWLLEFELLLATGDILRCSREENPDLFWQTCGGMGWTGVILSATFQLMHIPGTRMLQKTVKLQTLDAIFKAFDSHQDWPYAVAWLDCQAGSRGLFYAAHHFEENTIPAYSGKRSLNVPFFAPSWLLNRYSIQIHNQLMFYRAKAGEQAISLEQCFYPLDRIRNWNRLYGRRGFIQYQFCLPEADSAAGVAEVLETVRRSNDVPFLSVLKRYGEPPPEAIHSFPLKGYSLALDFPRTRTVFSLVKKLDEIVWRRNGKIYLTKDACSSARMGRIDPTVFGDPKFYSLLKERLLKR